MNYLFVKGNVKGKEKLSLSISPSDGLERELMNTLFNSEVEFQTVAGSATEEIIICKKPELSEKTERDEIKS